MRYGIGILLALWLAEPAAGQPEETKRVEPVVVTATKIETPAVELGASVTVVNGEDLQTYHYSTVDEALRNVPGLEITRSGSLGKLSTLSIRGANSNQVQVLVDASDPTASQSAISAAQPVFDFGGIPRGE